MNLPFEYDHVAVGEFGGTRPTTTDFERARVVILPVPLDRTTSYVAGTRNGPHEILVASSHMELWDEETQSDVHSVGIFTMPEMEFPYESMEHVAKEIRRVTGELVARDKFPVILGGEHSITPPVVAAMAARYPGMSVLQLDAHADLRDQFIRSLSPEEAEVVSALPTEVFYDYNMRDSPDWIERVVDSLSETVYITVDVDGFDPAIMPSTGTPEPGGLTWYEGLALLRRVIERRRVVGCDVVELSPLPGLVAPNFMCAKLIYKILSYRFAGEVNSA
jgi:N1-aminopropylagmatine ureohydrolase